MSEASHGVKPVDSTFACHPNADADVCDFLNRFSAEEKIDLNHPALKRVRFQDASSVKTFCRQIDQTLHEGASHVVLYSIADAFSQHSPLSWKTVDSYLSFGKSLMEVATPGGRVWTAGKILRVQAKNFLDEERRSCSTFHANCNRRYEAYEHARLVEHPYTKVQKVIPRLREAGFGYVIDAARREIQEALGAGPPGKEGLDKIFFEGKIEATPLDGALKGFAFHFLHLEGIKVGTLIIGDPKQGARVDLSIDEQRGIKRETIEDRYREKLQFQGAVAMDDQRILLGTTIKRGDVHRIKMREGFLDGLVIVDPEGGLRIADKRDLRSSDFSGDLSGKSRDAHRRLSLKEKEDLTTLIQEARRSKISVVSAASLDPEGRFEQWRDTNHDETVRLLFTFKDGRFGVLDAPGRSANQALAVLYRLQKEYGKLERVVMMDRGLYDTAGYYKDGIERVALGTQERPTRNTIVFYSDTSKRSGIGSD